MPDFVLWVPIAALLVDIACSALWVSWYFRLGIPIFRKRTRLGDAAGELDASFLANGYDEGKGAPLLLHALSPTEVAFREKLLSFARPNVALMRGLVRLEPVSGSFSTTGYANLFPIAVLVAWTWFLLSSVPKMSIGHVALMPVPLIIFGCIYATQASRFAGLHSVVHAMLTRDQRTARAERDPSGNAGEDE